MGYAEVKDQAPAPGLISQVVPNLYIAAPLACACRHSLLRVSGSAEQQPQYALVAHESVRNNGPNTPTTWLHMNALVAHE